ncbi:MAG: hypothetical protein ACFFCI_16875 [Promethearchaeota archaeon]
MINIIIPLFKFFIYGDTLMIIRSDHSENLGMLNVYGDHACYITKRVPMIIFLFFIVSQ